MGLQLIFLINGKRYCLLLFTYQCLLLPLGHQARDTFMAEYASHRQQLDDRHRILHEQKVNGARISKADVDERKRINALSLDGYTHHDVKSMSMRFSSPVRPRIPAADTPPLQRSPTEGEVAQAGLSSASTGFPPPKAHPECGPVLNLLNDSSTGVALSVVLTHFESRRSTVRDGESVEGPVAKIQITGKEEAARKAMIVANDVAASGYAVIREIVCTEADIDGTPLAPIVCNGSLEGMIDFYTWKLVHVQGYEGVKVGITMTEHPRFRRMLDEPPHEKTPEEGASSRHPHLINANHSYWKRHDPSSTCHSCYHSHVKCTPTSDQCQECSLACCLTCMTDGGCDVNRFRYCPACWEVVGCWESVDDNKRSNTEGETHIVGVAGASPSLARHSE